WADAVCACLGVRRSASKRLLHAPSERTKGASIGYTETTCESVRILLGERANRGIVLGGEQFQYLIELSTASLSVVRTEALIKQIRDEMIEHAARLSENSAEGIAPVFANEVIW